MAIALQTDSTLAAAFNRIAEQLRRSTVQVRGRHGPGGGSGVIWQPDGIIVTNAHVARGPEAVVTLADGRSFDVPVTARDDRRDLAALKMEAAGLPAAPIGDSGALRVGELVLAVGNPLGLAGAVTAGVVHATGSDGDGPRQREWVRADVRLAPGNSGGPLADAQGRVIGINSMIAGGLALAVPSNAVQNFLASGAARPYLGVTTQPVQVPLDGRAVFGLLVLDVADESPAAAGLVIGDVLIGMGGARFMRPDSMIRAVLAAAPGDILALDILRGGHSLTVAVRVGTRAPERQAA